MKKAIFMAAALLCAALSSCTINDIELISTSKDIKFNITVADVNPATKAIKQEWSNGDKLNVWFNESNNQQAPDIVLTYNGSTWETGDLRDGIDESHFSGQEMCKAYYEAFNDLSKYPTYSGGTLSRTVELGGESYSQMPMVLLGLSSYTFSENTVTAKIGEGIIIPNYYELQGWTYSNDLQVVITGLSAENAGKYTLSCPALSACTTITLTGSDATTEGAVAGVSNDDGVAFYFKIESTEQQNYTFTLTDYTDESNPVVKTYTATGKTLNSSSKTKCVGITIAASKFAAAPATPEYVEIGGVKWATKNLGATTVADSPETCYGDYFAWGETEPRYTSITISGYNSVSFGGWNSSHSSGYSESDFPTYTGNTLDSDHDAATQNWGTGWHTPTMADFQALHNACTGSTSSSSPTYISANRDISTGGVYYLCNTDLTIDGTKYGVKGILYVDNTDVSRRVFFPAAGYVSNTTFYSGGTFCYYWSSSLKTEDTVFAYALKFNNGNPVNPALQCKRQLGFSVRPVLK